MTTEFVSLRDEESGRTLGVLLMSLGRSTVQREDKTTIVARKYFVCGKLVEIVVVSSNKMHLRNKSK